MQHRVAPIIHSARIDSCVEEGAEHLRLLALRGARGGVVKRRPALFVTLLHEVPGFGRREDALECFGAVFHGVLARVVEHVVQHVPAAVIRRADVRAEGD